MYLPRVVPGIDLYTSSSSIASLIDFSARSNAPDRKIACFQAIRFKHKIMLLMEMFPVLGMNSRQCHP